MNAPELFHPTARAHRALLSFLLFALDEVRARARAMSRGPVCCVSVLTEERSGTQQVQLTRCAPLQTRRELAELFASLPPKSIVAWFPEETAR